MVSFQLDTKRKNLLTKSEVVDRTLEYRDQDLVYYWVNSGCDFW